MVNELNIDEKDVQLKSHVEYIKEKRAEENLNRLKLGIWVYFFLWIFEGALRKWILPGLATPLLIIRDPVAIWLLFMAWKNDMLYFNKYILSLYFITLLGLLAAVLVGHGSLIVALFGARIFFFHFPVIFIIGRVFSREDIIKLGKILFWIAIPMAVLIYFQFNSPQSALVNRGIGDNAKGGGFSGALGFFRPPGTFSFTTGNAQFFALVGAFVLYFLLNQKEIKGYLLIAATVCLLVAIPFSISRTLAFQLIVSAIFAVVLIIRRPKYFGRLVIALAVLFIVGLMLSKTSFIKDPVDALTSRFETADESEGGLGNTLTRLFADIQSPFQWDDFPFFGFGLGMGTNAGSHLLVGSTTFLIAEGEWGRVVGEQGIVLGLAIIFIRLALCFKLGWEAYKKLLANDFLSWMLLSVTLQSLGQGQWAQPGNLGFAVLVSGLTIAALKSTETDVKEESANDDLPVIESA